MKKYQYLWSAKKPINIRRKKMNRTFINRKKLPFVIGICLLALVIAASFSIFIGQVQAAPEVETSMDGNYIRSGYCSASRSLVHKAILQRLDFALSDGRGNALGLRDGNSHLAFMIGEMPLQRLDFALSDGRGNALGLRDGSYALLINVLAAIC